MQITQPLNYQPAQAEMQLRHSMFPGTHYMTATLTLQKSYTWISPDMFFPTKPSFSSNETENSSYITA